MDKAQLTRLLMATFLEELHEHVETMNRDFLKLEEDPSAQNREEILKSVFRAAHSVKGAARTVDIPLIEKACHALEEVLSEARKENKAFSAELMSLLFSTADALEEAGMRLREEQSLQDSPLSELLPQLERVAPVEPASDRPGQRPAALGGDSKKRPVGQATSEPASGMVDASSSRPSAEAVDVTSGASEIEPRDVASAVETSAATVRIAADKLDTLLRQSGELLIARRRVASRIDHVAAIRDQVADWWNVWRSVEKPLRMLLREDGRPDSGKHGLPRTSAVLGQAARDVLNLEKQLDVLVTEMTTDSRLLDQSCATLEDEVHYVRMLPFAHACSGLDRAVRDLALATGKEVRLVTGGADVEVDRSVLEALKDPLLHLVRNAIDHGVESPDERRSVGKPERATVSITASLRGGNVAVSIADDGRGVDLNRIREKARQAGRAIPEEEGDLVRMIFEPGFSTSAVVTDISGRGVGLDVVQNLIERLHGSVDIAFEPGRGTSFTLTMPLTLTTIHVVMVETAGQSYALPTSSVQHIVRTKSEHVRSVSGRKCLMLHGRPIPLASLTDTLGLTPKSPLPEDPLLGIVLVAGNQRVCLRVDAVLAEQEIVVKSLGTRIRRAPHFSGAALLPSGQISLVLNPNNVVRSALSRTPTQACQPLGAKPQGRRRLLVVEDAVTTRILMKSILEAADYDVSIAADGQRAWQMLAAGGFDLVVSDVDMPNMDGIELTEQIRRSPSLVNLPVILVTARATESDKTRGVRAGANAYLTKSGFDQQNLLDTIRQLL